MRKFCLCYLFLFLVFLILSQAVKAENIHFNDDIYKLKASETLSGNVIRNDYYKDNENPNFWTSMVEIKYYPDVTSPIKYSNDADKKIESDDKCVLLKFIQNKKNEIALISYLENGIQQDKTFFIYNIYKYEKHPKKGMMVLRFAKKYVFNTKEEIVKMANEVKTVNNDYMERLIISPIPPIVEKQIP